MDIVRGARRVVTGTANATTAAAGAVGGAAVNGIIGGVQGTATGIRNGLSSGSHSTPAAILTIGAVGAAGLVEWPVLLAVGGTALLVHQLNRSTGSATVSTDGDTSVTPLRTQSTTRGRATSRPAVKTPTKTTRARTASSRKATQARRTATARRSR